jgi:zinc transport system substrate-binding protein
MELTRRRLVTLAGAAGAGLLAGCLGGVDVPASDAASGTATAQSSFYVFGDVTTQVAGDTATSELLVPVGQHGHGWEPGPRVREAIGDADLLVHGMTGFQPWLDTIRTDLEADGSDVLTVDVSAEVDLLEAGAGHDDHEGEHGEDDHDHEGMDPHFWMDPLRLRTAVGTVEAALADVDGGNAAAYEENATAFRERLDGLHERMESVVAEATTETILVAGHDSFQYLGDRYGVEVEALTNVSPDDQPTPRDIERAQKVVEHHGLRYICADPLESQRAAEQLVAETGAEAVLPLTAMPGLTPEWDKQDWGYVEVMENVNLPTLERALGV